MATKDRTQRPKRMRRNGRLVRVKRSDSAKNARPKVKFLVHGRHRALLRDPLDARTRVGRAYAAQMVQYRQHLGGDVSVAQEKLIDQAARLGLLADIAWGELIRSGRLIKRGSVNAAFDPFLRASRDLRAILLVLGLKRHAKEATLKDVLEGESTVQGEAL